ncbi:MAG: tetratricopeptide repeat protein [bacterium]
MSKAALIMATVLSSCGNRPNPPPPEKKDAAPVDAAVVELAARPLGMPDLAAYGWRKRGGQPAFRLARKGEERGDWAAVVASCRQALAADADHLEAAWLLAIGYAKLGQNDQVLAPLSQAVAGELARWGTPSLEHPALQAFLATTIGAAWRQRVEQDRALFAGALGRGLIVTAEGEVFAVDVETRRWNRLTRNPGTVVGSLAIPAARQIAYIARASKKAKRELGIGVIDLGRGTATGQVPLGTPGPITMAYSARAPVGFWVGSGGARPAWRQFDEDLHLRPLPPKTARPAGPWLDITAKGTARLHALPPNVTADWDDQSLASAVRIGTSNRVVSVPSPGLIDGNSAAWSPDRAHLAFVAQLDDHCAAGAVNTAAFVADAATGGAKELERAAGGIALVWIAERTLAIAGDGGVTIRSLDGAAPIEINGATGLMIPRERPRCAPAEIDEPPSEPESAGDEPTDAGVADAP